VPYESALLQLAGWRGKAVTSLYLDVDGRSYPRPSDYEPHVEHLFRLARKRAEPLGKSVVEALEADLARISGWLEAGLDRKSTRGIAVFSCAAEGLFETFSLPLVIRDQVAVASTPDIAQLAAALAASEQALVVAIDNQRSRLLRLELGEVEEREAPIDQIERRVDTDVELGSFEHRHEELAAEHYRRVARAVAQELEERPAKHLVLSGTQEAVSRLEGYLSQRALAIVSGRIRLPLRSLPAELAHAAREVVREAEHRRKVVLIQELRERVGQRAGAVAGLAATLESLGARRVRTLVVEDGFEAEGGRCAECGQLLAKRAACPRCGSATLGVSDVVGAAISEALAYLVELEFCEAGELVDLGHIGALERR